MPTIYSHYSDKQLYELFRAENWHSGRMSDLQRQQALQELSNRDAAANGTRQCPVEVSGNTQPFGAYNRGTGKIYLNDEFVNRGTNCMGDDHPPIWDANLRAMNTVFHENEHVRQHEMVERPPEEGDDLQLRRDLTSNFHPFNYIRSEYDYDLYRIQICEKDANEVGNAKTMAAMRSLEKDHGGQADPNMKYYEGSIDQSYQRSLESARFRYDDPHVEETLQKAMDDNAFHDREIAENMGSSYYDIRSLMAQQEIDTYEEYISAHPELDPDQVDAYTKVIQDRSEEIDALDKAWSESEANPDALSAGAQSELSEGDYSTEDEYSTEDNYSTEGDYSTENDYSAKNDYSAGDDTGFESDSGAESDGNGESDGGESESNSMGLGM